MSDEELHDSAALYAVDALSGDELAEFERHLATCAFCEQEVAELRELTAELATDVASEPPESLRAAVLGRLADTPQVGPVPAADDDAPVVALDSRRRTRTEEPAARRGWTSRVPYLVAAAAVLVAAVFGGWALQSRQDAQQASDRQQQILQVLAAPDVRTSTSAGPADSSGTVVVSDAEGQALFVARGMPALPQGKTYQLWTLKDGATSAGTFGDGGSASVVELPSAALNADQVAVSVEPAGGSQQPTSAPVMVVSVPPST